MNDNFKKNNYGDGIIFFEKQDIILNSMIVSSGFSLETSISYDWDGIKRGNHEFVLFQYTFEGEGKLVYNDKERSIKPGEAMILFFPYNNRYFLPEYSSKWEFIYLCLNGTELMKIWKDLIDKFGPVIKLSEDSITVELAISIYEKVKSQSFYSQYEASSFAYNFAMSLIGDLNRIKSNDKIPSWIEKVEKYLKENFEKDISVEKLSKISGYSRYHFTRLFTANKGISPQAYLNRLRIKKSAELLKETNFSIKEISYKCGFPDTNYFCKIFKKYFTISPGNFRKSGL